MGYVLSRKVQVQRTALLDNGHVLVRYDALIPGHQKEQRGMAVTCSCDQRASVTETGPEETYETMRDRATTLLPCLATTQ